MMLNHHTKKESNNQALLKIFYGPDFPRQTAFTEDPVVLSYSRENSAKNVNGIL